MWAACAFWCFRTTAYHFLWPGRGLQKIQKYDERLWIQPANFLFGKYQYFEEFYWLETRTR